MGWSPFLIFVGVQCVIAVVLFFAFRRLLHRELISAALEQLQSTEIVTNTREIVVTTAGGLNVEIKNQLEHLLHRKDPSLKIIFEEDPLLKGGIVLELPSKRMDFSVTNRLKSLWP